MSMKEVPRGFLLYWATACVYRELSVETIRDLASSALKAGVDDPALIDIYLSDDLRSEEADELLVQFLTNQGLTPPSRDDLCTAIARSHIRTRISKGDSLADAAFSLPGSCIYYERGKINVLGKLKYQGENILFLRSRSSWFLSREYRQKIRDSTEDFERNTNELAVGVSRFNEDEIALIKSVAKEVHNDRSAVDYWFSPFISSYHEPRNL